MATLRKRNSTYFIDYRIRNRRLRKKVGHSKKLAELALKDIEVKIAKNEIGFIDKDSTIDKLFKDFISYSETNHSKGTTTRYKEIIANFSKFLNEQPYVTKTSQLNPSLFEKYKASRKSSIADITINHELTILKTIFNMGIKWNMIRKNPLNDVPSIKIKNKKTPRFLSGEECKKLLANCDDRTYPIFFTLLNTGMRRGEVINLEWKDIDFERRIIKIQIKDTWQPKTGERDIPINAQLFKLLEQLHKKRRKGSFVFYNSIGNKIHRNKLRTKLIQIAKKADIPELTKLHTLRHTFASHLVMKGVDLASVQKLMGHADIKTTMIYSHLAPEHLKGAVDKLNF